MTANTKMPPPQLESPMNSTTSLESFATIRKLHPATTRKEPPTTKQEHLEVEWSPP